MNFEKIYFEFDFVQPYCFKVALYHWAANVGIGPRAQGWHKVTDDIKGPHNIPRGLSDTVLDPYIY